MRLPEWVVVVVLIGWWTTYPDGSCVYESRRAVERERVTEWVLP